MPGQIFQTRFLSKAVALSVRRPLFFIGLFSAITLVFLFFLFQLSFRTSIYDLAVKDLPDTQYYEEFKKEFGSEEIILAVIRGDNVFSPQNFQLIDSLSQSFSQLPGVRRVVSLSTIKADMDLTKKWDVAQFEKLLGPVDLFWKNFLATDKTATIISLVLSANADQAQIIEVVEQELVKKTPEGVKSYAIGMPIVARALATYTEKDFQLLPALTFLVILGVLWLLFGGVRAMLFPAGAVAMALCWTLGLMSATGTALSLMTMIVPVFIIAVGTAYCMHVMVSYREAAREAANPSEAAFLGFSRVGFPTTLAVLTTTVGLASLLFNRIDGIQEFAVFSCVGMASILLIILFFLPALLTVFPVSPEKSQGPLFVQKALEKAVVFVTTLALQWRRTVFAFLSLVIVSCFIACFFIEVETNPVDYFKKSTDVSQRFYDIYQDMAGSFPVNVVLDARSDSYFEEPDNLEKIEQIQNHLVTLDGVDKTVAFTDFLKLVRYASEDYDPQYYTLPRQGYQARMLTNSYKTMLGQDMYESFMNVDMSRANIMLRTHIASSRDFFKLRQEISTYLEKNFSEDFSFQVTGLGMVIATSSHVLTSSLVKSLGLTLTVIFMIMLLLFLSGRVGAAALITNIFPILICFGFMGMAGIKLSVVTSLIASIAIGLAVDDTLHYLVRYNREFKKDLDKDRALTDTIRAVGPAVMFTTLTISLGFAVLLFSRFQPTSVFGVLMVLTMLAALIGDLLLLPALMLHIELITAWDVLSLVPSVGGISSGIAHELRQPLNTIKLGAEFLNMLAKDHRAIEPEEFQLAVNGINQEVDRAAAYINRLARFGQRPSGPMEATDINAPVGDTIALARKQFELDNVKIESELTPDLPRVLAHGSSLSQAVFNLLNNAREAVMAKEAKEGEPPDRTIRVKTYLHNGRVCLSVGDHGAGIPRANRDRIMEPFFTTKPQGHGFGLGLAVTREIVRDFHGRLWFETKRGEGSTFYVSFPPALGE